MVKQLITKAKLRLRPLKWKFQRQKLRRALSSHGEYEDQFQGRILILVPHADDEWIGCSSIVRNMSNVLLFNCSMDGGDSDELHQTRYGELSQIAKKYFKTLVTANGDLCASLCDTIVQYAPRYIFVPHYYDWHDEHIAVMMALKQAIDQLKYECSVAMYQVSLPILPNNITHILPLDRKWHRNKWNIFCSVYKTQVVIPYRRFAENERINGALCDSFAAEVFSVKGSLTWTNELDRKLLSNEEKNTFKSVLNDIDLTRKMLSNLSQEIDVLL